MLKNKMYELGEVDEGNIIDNLAMNIEIVRLIVQQSRLAPRLRGNIALYNQIDDEG